MKLKDPGASRKPTKRQIDFLRAIEHGKSIVKQVGGKPSYSLNLGYGWAPLTADVERLVILGWVKQTDDRMALELTNAGRDALAARTAKPDTEEPQP